MTLTTNGMRVLRKEYHSGLKLSREFSKKRKWSWTLKNEKDLGEGRDQRDFLERATAQMRMRRFCRMVSRHGLARMAGSYCGREIMCR